MERGAGTLWRVVGAYVAFSAAWILLSDRLLSAVAADLESVAYGQTLKGLFFVGASASVIYFLLSRELRARHAAETAASAIEARYRAFFDNSLDALALTSPDGRILAANRAATRLFGRSEEELCRLGRAGVVDPEDPRLAELLDARAQSGQAVGTLRFTRSDGTRFEGEASSSVFDTADGPRTALCVRDITDRLRAERDLEEHRAALEGQVHVRTAELEANARELGKAKTRAESADRLKSAFLATMSHELRTPLNSIIGFTGLLAEGIPGELNAEQKKQLDIVKGSAQHLLALINDVLDISKIEAGQLTVACGSVELAPVITGVLRTLGPSAKAKGLALNDDVAADLPNVLAERRRLEQVLLNLVGNAIKFTAAGSVRVCARPNGQGELQVDVQDTGIGIAAADLETVFEPFRQVEGTLARRYEGTGLGLSISRRLVELMRGRIWVTSTPNTGSTFSFALPTATRAPEETT